MTVVYITAWAVVALVAVHAAIGWFLANRLRDALLRVYPREKDLSVRVRRVSDASIVLEAPGPRQDIGHPGILGIVWADGHGRVGEVVEAGGSTITRVFHPVVGAPPLCDAPLEECEPIELDSFVFQTDPGDVGLEFDTVRYETELGPMGAWAVPGGDGRRWVVMSHGWTVDRRELLRMLPPVHRSGWSSLIIDYRNDAGAPADPSGHHRFGLSEWRDLEAAVSHVIELGAKKTALMGCSTGGALVMSFLECSDLAGRVSAVILDSPNLVLADTVRVGTSEMRATRLMTEVGMWIADLRWKIDWDRTNYLPRVAEFLTAPALVFHGTSDQTVPINQSRQLRAAVPEMVDLVETTAAGHVMSWNADPKRYERHLERFLGSI